MSRRLRMFLLALPALAVLGSAPFRSAARGSPLSLLSLVASPAAAAAPGMPRFTLEDLGTLGGASSSANGINDLYQVVGSSLILSGDEHAFLTADGKITDLGTLGGASSVALGINNFGHLVGNSLIAQSAAQHAFLASGGKMTDLRTLGGLSSSANGVNDLDQATGYSFISVQGHSPTTGIVSLHAFLYSGGKMADLGTLGGQTSNGTSINAFGQVVGSSFTAGNGAQHAFLYSDGKMRDLGTLGGLNSTGLGVNALGQAVGNAFVSGNVAFHTFLFSDGKMLDLNTLGGPNSSADGINALGQVVGESDTASGAEHAFFWQGGAMVDLNSLAAAGSAWELNKASAISDGGEIVGSGTYNGQTRAFMLIPISERALTAPEASAVKDGIDHLIDKAQVAFLLPRRNPLQLGYLVGKLQAVRQKLDRGDGLAARNLLQSFAKIVARLTDQELAPDKRQSLIDAAQAVMAPLGN